MNVTKILIQNLHMYKNTFFNKKYKKKILELLNNNKCDLKYKNSNGETLLILACKIGFEDLALKLLDNYLDNCNITYKCSKILTRHDDYNKIVRYSTKRDALFYALMNNMKRVVLKLLEHKSIINNLNSSYLIYSKSFSFFSTSPLIFSYTPLIIACKKNMKKIALKILEYNCSNIDHTSSETFSKDETTYKGTLQPAIYYAYKNNMKEVVSKIMSLDYKLTGMTKLSEKYQYKIRMYNDKINKK